ncbi:hypothetical protein DEU56DRAFT_949282 [Suillus clintonianus]|uniref:uncharacterized protein n=1 Tax=Suillus clintonianus TaxID=1904413 RepID=UPI001B86E6F0|nr:uncharacterized protein DEU56DRAFT_949282 [Suillus clintonianus]KAG2135328.1 hypothetical protein DEU56DRAFT_949282 [Suillus clintonianus]
MLLWLSLALVLTTSVAAFAGPSQESKEPSDAPAQCRARAWVRAPDMVPGDVIAGDVMVKLSGPCTDVESYALGLRYKEKVFWKLRREDAPIPKRPTVKYNSTLNRDLFQVRGPSQASRNSEYNETEWRVYENSIQNKDLWSVHEEERIAFETKTPLVAERIDPLSRSFTTRFGILVPNTNYPPGLDCRQSGFFHGPEIDTISGESIYDYFVEIIFKNGTTSDIHAGITAFIPFDISTENKAPSVNVSLAPGYRGPNMKPSVDRLRSNYTIEVSFPEGAHVYQRYTNRTDIPVQLCAFSGSAIEWHSQELQNRSQPYTLFTKALVPSVQYSQSFQFFPPLFHSPCREVNFTAPLANLTHESHIFSASSEPISLSLNVGRDAVPDFSTYYQKLGHRVKLSLNIKPDPTEPLDEIEKMQWERQLADVDETDFDWVPWIPFTQTRRRSLEGDAHMPVIPTQKQEPVQSTLVHYLSDKARQPVIVDWSDIADLRLMSPEERDLIAPLAQPSIKVFPKGEELLRRYFTGTDMQRPIYVGDTWVKKVLPMVAEGQRERDTTDRLLVVQ